MNTRYRTAGKPRIGIKRKLAAPPSPRMILILTNSYKEALDIAKSFGLLRSQWKHVGSVVDVLGFEDPVCLVSESFGERADYKEIYELVWHYESWRPI